MEISTAEGPIRYAGITGPTGPTGSPTQPPDYFIDGAKIQFSQVGIALTLLRSRPQLSEEAPTNEAVAILRMSPEMAAHLSSLIVNALQTLQAQAALEAQTVAGAVPATAEQELLPDS